MSAFPDDPEHFWRWLIARGEIDGSDPFIFVPRYIYGEYLNDLITGVEAVESQRGRLHIVHEECTSLAESASGVEVGLGNGASLIAHHAVLAIGHDDQTPVPDVADDDAARDLPILILGTGLSMVDAYLSLRDEGHRGPIIAMSRRGLLPKVHKRTTPLRIDAADVPFGTKPHLFHPLVPRLCRNHRARTRRLAHGGRCAPAVQPEHLAELDAAHPASAFSSTCGPWWDIHRTACRRWRMRNSPKPSLPARAGDRRQDPAHRE